MAQTPHLAWLSARKIGGIRSNLVRDIRACTDGAHVTLDLSTARQLVQVCDQAMAQADHTAAILPFKPPHQY